MGSWRSRSFSPKVDFFVPSESLTAGRTAEATNMDKLLTDIPVSTFEPFERTLEVDANGLDLQDAEPRFPNRGSVRVFVEPVGDGYVLTGRVRLHAEMDCSRCLEPVSVRIDEPFRCILSRSPMDPAPEEDWILLEHEENQFDLAPLVRELILVSLPAKPLCGEACGGLCPECGANLNQGPCGCVEARIDPRWAALSTLGFGCREESSSKKEMDYDGSSQEESLKKQKE